MLNGVPGGDPLTFSIAVVAALAASALVYRDADRHGHYHAVSASAAVGVAALVGFAVANLVGLVVATGYVLLLYLLSYPSTPGVDGTEKRRTPDRPDGSPQGDAGENIAGAEDVVSVIRIEIASEGTLRDIAAGYDDVPTDAPVGKLRSMLRVKALDTVVSNTDTEASSLADWAEASDDGVDDWHEGQHEENDEEAERPAEGAAAWNAAPADGTDDAEGPAGDDGLDDWNTESIDEEAEEVSTGNLDDWATASDGGESAADTDHDRASSDTGAAGFGWAEVEAEE
ncbi:hypothetical protein JCM30237_19420 [Halolamina litorea]|uniref:Uncharacterized protein n=1 Tax=Halolamina litorea TaxID=1515593 RepID=A0ABD6BV24_9EURY|nr:hypothetical protein [Halolamina litorea]